MPDTIKEISKAVNILNEVIEGIKKVRPLVSITKTDHTHALGSQHIDSCSIAFCSTALSSSEGVRVKIEETFKGYHYTGRHKGIVTSRYCNKREVRQPFAAKPFNIKKIVTYVTTLLDREEWISQSIAVASDTTVQLLCDAIPGSVVDKTTSTEFIFRPEAGIEFIVTFLTPKEPNTIIKMEIRVKHYHYAAEFVANLDVDRYGEFDTETLVKPILNQFTRLHEDKQKRDTANQNRVASKALITKELLDECYKASPDIELTDSADYPDRVVVRFQACLTPEQIHGFLYREQELFTKAT